MIKQPPRYDARRPGRRALPSSRVALVLEVEYRRARRELLARGVSTPSA